MPSVTHMRDVLGLDEGDVYLQSTSIQGELGLESTHVGWTAEDASLVEN